MARPTMAIKHERMGRCNDLLRVIASCGAQHFGKNKIAYLQLNQQGQIFLVDCWTQRHIFTHYTGQWRHFSQGGTMRNLIIAMREYICGDLPNLGGHLGPWAEWICGGDLWGYGDDMTLVRQVAIELGLLKSNLEGSSND